MAASRHFIIELDDKIKNDAVLKLRERPTDAPKLLEHAGYIRGLDAAKQLYEEIVRHNNAKD